MTETPRSNPSWKDSAPGKTREDVSDPVESGSHESKEGSQDFSSTIAFYRSLGFSIKEAKSVCDGRDKLSANEARELLAGFYLEGNRIHEIDPDQSKAISWLRAAAVEGSTTAMCRLAEILASGQISGASKSPRGNWRSSFAWYLKAAKLGSREAMDKVAFCYWNGSPAYANENWLKVDKKAAVEWWRKAAELGSTDAVSNLRNHADEIKDIEKDAFRISQFSESAGKSDSSKIKTSRSEADIVAENTAFALKALQNDAAGGTAAGNKETSPSDNNKLLAESSPDAFHAILERRVLDDLMAVREKNDFSCLTKYESFLDTVENETTRSQSRELLRDLRENYVKTWHVRYPIKLATRWHEIKGNPVAKKDFREILQLKNVHALGSEAAVVEAMEPLEGLTLFNNVEYLDPLKTALSKLGGNDLPAYRFKSNRIGSRNRVESAGFPLDTFDYYSFDVEHNEDGVNRLIFMVDSLERVIAVQEIIESPKSVRLSSHNNNRSVYNFLQMRRKGASKYLIGYEGSRGERNGNTVTLVSELLDENRKPREWIALHIPRRIAEVCMFCCTEIVD